MIFFGEQNENNSIVNVLNHLDTSISFIIVGKNGDIDHRIIEEMLH